MKKILTAILAILAVSVLFASCGKAKPINVKAAEDLIEAIDKNINLDSKESIENAQKAIDILTDEEKSQVSNMKKYEKAKEEYDGIIGFNNDIDAILKAADPSFSKSDNNMTDLIARYDEMKKEYKKMSKARKEMVSPDYEKLEAAIETLKNYADTATQSAAAYVRAFNDVNKGKNYTVTNIGCIKQVRNEKEYHFFALTYTDAKGAEKNVYSTARFSGPEAYATIMTKPELFFADKPVSDDYDALKNSNTNLDVAAVIAAANALDVTPPAVTAAPETTTKKSDKKKDNDKKETTTAEAVETTAAEKTTAAETTTAEETTTAAAETTTKAAEATTKKAA